MRPDLVDNDFAPAVECDANSRPQVTILEAAPASPPAFVKALDQVIAVFANNQIAPMYAPVAEGEPKISARSEPCSSPGSGPKRAAPGRRTLRERHLARDTHCAPTSSDTSPVMALFPAAWFRVR